MLVSSEANVQEAYSNSIAVRSVGGYIVGSSIGFPGFRIAITFADLHIFGIVAVVITSSQKACSHRTAAGQMFFSMSGKIPSGPATFPAFVALRALMITSVVKACDKIDVSGQSDRASRCCF